MLFNSFSFILLFLPLVWIIARNLRGRPLLIWITLASYAFYAQNGIALFVLPMLATTLLDFAVAQRLESLTSTTARKFWLSFSLMGNLGLLFYFKYTRLILKTVGFFMGQNSALTDAAATFGIFLPPGISFYTFQTLSYVLDVYGGRCRAERKFWTFASFVSFFPHLVAGPLTRHNQLIPALDNIEAKGIQPRWSLAIFLFSIGLCKKVLLADRIADFIDPWIVHPSSMSSIQAWCGMLGYGLQIYFDFSGYSDMAIGLGLLFGVQLPKNFDSPYRAINPRDFWKRWHITLSAWLRDYLYIPLGGNRDGKSRQFINLVITMFLGGLWHGANWTYAIWGLYHGFLLILYHSTEEWWDRLPIPFQRLLTFSVVSVGWIFFRSDSIQHAGQWLSALVFAQAPASISMAAASFIIGGLCIISRKVNSSSYEVIESLPCRPQMVLGLLTAVALLCLRMSSRFLYYQF